MLRSRMPIKLIFRVLGIGVADMASVSTECFICLIFSLCFTPNFALHRLLADQDS